MRLRLRIERNALPSTQALWPVKDGKSTIAQLLQQVNDVFPLEGETWGLEDYSVTVGGYECLHYHELSGVCRDEDEVVIKPLEYVEVRARTLTGRSQITADGRHLVDGVPFGKPCLKGPTRPEVRIPPRKRRKLLGDGHDEESQLMITQYGEEVDDDEEEEDQDDVDFDVDASEDSVSSDESSESESDDSEDSDSSKTDSHSSSSDSDSSSDSESDDESWDGLPASNQTTPKLKATVGLPNGTGMGDSPKAVTGTKRKRGSGSRDHELESSGQSRLTNGRGKDLVPPHEGKMQTKVRNHRRRDAKKLKHLKMMNVLPPDAKLSTLREWRGDSRKPKLDIQDNADEATKNNFDGTVVSAAPNNEAVEPGQQEAHAISFIPTLSTDIHDRAHANGFVPPAVTKKSSKRSKPDSKTPDPVADAFRIKRQKLLSDIASGGIDITTIDSEGHRRSIPTSPEAEEDKADAPEQLSIKHPFEASGDKDRTTQADLDRNGVESAMEAYTPTRRAQLDISSSKRLLFASLGVRVPKTQEERDRVQKKLAERPKRNANALNHEGSATIGVGAGGTSAGAEAWTELDQAEEDPESWREKLHVTAVECCDEGVKLSTPPFPFRKNWDPQYSKRRQRNSQKYAESSTKRRSRDNTEYVETYDKYNINEDGDALDYDDVDAEAEYWEDGALLGDDYGAEAEQDDGFPEAPANLGILPPLSVDDTKDGDFIAFTELAVDETTGWQPKTVTRTAKVVVAPQSGSTPGQLIIQLAARDLKAKVFDEDGNRVYGRFEMPDDENDDAEDDEGRREVSWSDLGEVKLVFRPEIVVEI